MWGKAGAAVRSRQEIRFTSDAVIVADPTARRPKREVRHTRIFCRFWFDLDCMGAYWEKHSKPSQELRHPPLVLMLAMNAVGLMAIR